MPKLLPSFNKRLPGGQAAPRRSQRYARYFCPNFGGLPHAFGQAGETPGHPCAGGAVVLCPDVTAPGDRPGHRQLFVLLRSCGRLSPFVFPVQFP